jgi:thiamine-monophosphate kinase
VKNIQAPSREDQLLDWLQGQLSGAGQQLLGDDAAVLRLEGEWAISLDSQIEGVHFPADLAPSIVARRLLAVSLSDLAAMGALPRYAFLALNSPSSFDHKEFFRAFLEACGGYQLVLGGGDLATSASLCTTLTVVGARRGRHRWLLRGGARVGDRLWVGGTLGESAAGRLLIAAGARWDGESRPELPARFSRSPEASSAAARAVIRHLAPRPQLQLGRWLAQQPSGGVLDISDGLSLDLSRLCRESGVGAQVERRRLPLPRGFRSLCDELGRQPTQLALSGGEDYVLLFSLPVDQEPPPELGCFAIGATCAARELSLRSGNRIEPLLARGWDHLAARGGAGPGNPEA